MGNKDDRKKNYKRKKKSRYKNFARIMREAKVKAKKIKSEEVEFNSEQGRPVESTSQLNTLVCVPVHKGNREIWLDTVGRNDLLGDNSVSHEICANHYKQHLEEISHIKQEKEAAMNILPFDDVNLSSNFDFHKPPNFPEIPPNTSYVIKFEPDEELDVTELDIGSIMTQTIHENTQADSVYSVNSEQIPNLSNIKIDKVKENQNEVKSIEIKLKTENYAYSEDLLTPKDT